MLRKKSNPKIEKLEVGKSIHKLLYLRRGEFAAVAEQLQRE